MSILQSTRWRLRIDFAGSVAIHASRRWHQPHHGAPKCSITGRPDSFDAASAFLRLVAASRAGAWLASRNAMTFAGSWAPPASSEPVS